MHRLDDNWWLRSATDPTEGRTERELSDHRFAAAEDGVWSSIVDNRYLIEPNRTQETVNNG